MGAGQPPLKAENKKETPYGVSFFAQNAENRSGAFVGGDAHIAPCGIQAGFSIYSVGADDPVRPGDVPANLP